MIEPTKARVTRPCSVQSIPPKEEKLLQVEIPTIIAMDDDFDGTEIRVDEPTTSTATLSKRKRKREKEKANKQQNSTKKAKSSSDDEDGGVKLKPSKAVAEGKNDGSINEDIAKMDPSLLADYVGQRLKHWEKSLSSVELEDKYIPGWSSQPTTILAIANPPLSPSIR